MFRGARPILSVKSNIEPSGPRSARVTATRSIRSTPPPHANFIYLTRTCVTVTLDTSMRDLQATLQMRCKQYG